MKFNSRFFSFPPHLSTSWSNVSSLRATDGTLVISLADGGKVLIRGLNENTLQAIFEAHSAYLEEESARPKTQTPKESPRAASAPPTNPAGVGVNLETEMPIRLGIGTLDGLGTAMQHNPAQANAPDLPKDILHKIATISKIMAPEEANLLPQAEPHCNCMFCQIARTIRGSLDGESEESPPLPNKSPSHQEDEISTEELSFQQWEITQTGDKLFNVTNKLDSQEHYSVYLGHPVGCTCGRVGCEHIIAVLKS